MDNAIVITTINPPKKEIYKFSKYKNWQLICVGDTTTPKDWHVDNTDYLSPKFSKVFPWKMYARKNLGYLYAIKNGAKIIYESDDDMLPYSNFPPVISVNTTTTVLSGKKFINIYNFFKEKKGNKNPVWVRGFPLDCINDQKDIKRDEKKAFTPFINSVQDNDSDFDAIYRFLYNKRLNLKKTGSFALGKGSYAPVNTQGTFSYPPMYPLLYLPASPGFHVEDIVRGYISQRIMWEFNAKMLFIYPTARTNNRNPHNYWKDFELEIPLFLKTNKLISILDSLSLYKDPLKSLLKVYKELVKQDFFPKTEMGMVEAWAREIEKII